MPKPRLPKSAKPPQGLPDRETLLAFLREHGEADRGDIAQAFGLKGADRRALRMMVKALEAEGALGRRGRKGMAMAGSLPPVGVVDVVERDADGDLYVRLVKAGDDAPAVRLAPGAHEAGSAPGLGDRLLVRFERLEGGEAEAKVIKRLGQSAHKILGVIRKSRREIRVEPVDRKTKESLILFEADARELKDGDLVLAQVGIADRPHGPKRGKVIEVVGREDQPRAASLIAIHTHGIPMGFTPAAEAEAEAGEPPQLDGRFDLRDLPLITIDPADARDHDDAVYAHPDEAPGNVGGQVVWVAIADVAAYVRSGSALDREAREKANSVYFPDRVEPMLPERLSNGLCSLRQGENRACLAVRMVFDANGRKVSHRFVRGLMRSAAKLSYEEAQAAIDGAPGEIAGPLMAGVLTPLWNAYRTMQRGRDKRAPLDIDSTERRIVISPQGEVVSITPRVSLEAHKLIEEMMVQANVCAAETLEQKRVPLIYRVHDAPSAEKLQNLSEFLATLGVAWNRGEAARTDRFNRLLAQMRGGPHGEIVNEVVLRTQMQAHYSNDNIGHFGLNLDPPLRGPDRAPGADQGPGPGRRRPERRRHRPATRDRRAHHPGRTPRHGRRARRHRPLRRRLHGRQGRRRVRRPHHRGHPFWPVRAPDRHRRRRPRAGLQPGERVFHPRRQGPRPGRRTVRRPLAPRRPSAGEAVGSDPDHRRPAVRDGLRAGRPGPARAKAEAGGASAGAEAAGGWEAAVRARRLEVKFPLTPFLHILALGGGAP